MSDGKAPFRNSNSTWFGKYEELGKTEARQSFLRLLDEIQSESTTVAITDRGERVAVIMGFKQYELLVTALKQRQLTDAKPLEGLIVKAGDLEADNLRVKKMLRKSVQKTSKSIN